VILIENLHSEATKILKFTLHFRGRQRGPTST
jgi:hypothetical protein